MNKEDELHAQRDQERKALIDIRNAADTTASRRAWTSTEVRFQLQLRRRWSLRFRTCGKRWRGTTLRGQSPRLTKQTRLRRGEGNTWLVAPVGHRVMVIRRRKQSTRK
ncbi:unnamed protein product [Musa textilis]